LLTRDAAIRDPSNLEYLLLAYDNDHLYRSNTKHGAMGNALDLNLPTP